jgi:uncharacterized membrane protein
MSSIIDRCRVWLPALYLLYAIPAVIYLAVVMPPFQVTDERAHFERADQIAHGTLVSARYGGTIDEGAARLGALYQPMWFHPEVKQTLAFARQAAAVRWSGQVTKTNFQNTAQYGPFLYAPQALGILIARAADLTVAQSLIVTRWLNGLTCCALAALALALCRRGRALMFATLLLPMTLSQFGSASQDALMIALSLLAIAVTSRVVDDRRPATTAEFAFVACVVVATTMARPTQIALILLLGLLVGRGDRAGRAKALITAAALVLIGAWLYVLRGLLPPVPPTWSYATQFDHLIADPLRLPTVLVQSFVKDGYWLLTTLLGRLGWLDTVLPDWYYLTAAAVLVVALLAPGNRGFRWFGALVAALAFAGMVAAIAFTLYLSWNPVDYETINGLQGRYILPILPLLAWLVPGYGARGDRWLSMLWLPVLVLPLVSLAVLPDAVMERYYGSWSVMTGSLEALLLR